PLHTVVLPALPPAIDWLPPVALMKMLAPLPPRIVSPATPPIVSLPPLPPVIVSVAAPQIVSLPPLPPSIGWWPGCASRDRLRPLPPGLVTPDRPPIVAVP